MFSSCSSLGGIDDWDTVSSLVGSVLDVAHEILMIIYSGNYAVWTGKPGPERTGLDWRSQEPFIKAPAGLPPPLLLSFAC